MRSLMLFAGLLNFAASDADAAPSREAASGKTQVVAKAGGREITLTEVRLEMIRLRLSPTNPNAERTALDSLVNRHVLAEAARKAGLHKKPEALARMRAAEEEALAAFYYATAAAPPEPTRSEIEDFIAENPTLFAERRRYDFAVLTLPTATFEGEDLTPLFDEATDFAALTAKLKADGVDYTLAPSVRDGSSFPEPIRVQLGAYGPGDNIVLRGAPRTEIFKIIRMESSALSQSEQRPLARRLLMEAAARERGARFVERLRDELDLEIYRATAAPLPVSEAAAIEARAAEGRLESE